MTQDELLALVELLSRTPMTRAEALWVSALLARLKEAVEVQQDTEQDTEGKREE